MIKFPLYIPTRNGNNKNSIYGGGKQKSKHKKEVGDEETEIDQLFLSTQIPFQY